jgi:hypothetical protein
MRNSAPAHGPLAVLCTAMYIVGFFIALPILVLIVVASAQQADFGISGAALVVLAVVAVATREAWRRMP